MSDTRRKALFCGCENFSKKSKKILDIAYFSMYNIGASVWAHYAMKREIAA